MTGDLHCHSVFSDGSSTPDEIIKYARNAGLDFIALTDHDTMAGVERMKTVGTRQGVKVISGVEITSFDNESQRMVHLLCYMPRKLEKLEKLMQFNLNERTEAVKPIVEEVAKTYPITLADVLEEKGQSQCLFRQHIIRSLMDRGYTYAVFSDLYDIFKKIPYKPNFPEAREVAEILNQTKGVVVLAHPGRYDSIALGRELAEKGLIQGIEINHPSNTDEDRKEIEKIALDYCLVPTGGSDFHGFYSATPHPLGTCRTTENALDALIERWKAIK